MCSVIVVDNDEEVVVNTGRRDHTSKPTAGDWKLCYPALPGPVPRKCVNNVCARPRVFAQHPRTFPDHLLALLHFTLILASRTLYA